MKTIVFDTGPIISLTLNNLCHILDGLKEKSNVVFYIPPKVKRELVDKPIETRKFKFEALQVLYHIKKGTINIYDNKNLHPKAKYLLDLANSCYSIDKRNVEIVHYAEIQAVAAALILDAPVVVIDERTTRMLCEKPENLHKLLETKLHTKIRFKKENLAYFSKFRFIRSSELVYIAYKKNLVNLKNENVLDALLYAVKYKSI